MLINTQYRFDDSSKKSSRRNAVGFSQCEGSRPNQMWQDMPQKNPKSMHAVEEQHHTDVRACAAGDTHAAKDVTGEGTPQKCCKALWRVLN